MTRLLGLPEPHGVARDRLAQDVLEGMIIRSVVKNAGTRIGAVAFSCPFDPILCRSILLKNFFESELKHWSMNPTFSIRLLLREARTPRDPPDFP